MRNKEFCKVVPSLPFMVLGIQFFTSGHGLSPFDLRVTTLFVSRRED